MNSAHSMVIQIKRRGDRVMRGLHCEPDEFIGYRVDPLCRSAVWQQKDTTIKRRFYPVACRERLSGWRMTTHETKVATMRRRGSLTTSTCVESCVWDKEEDETGESSGDRGGRKQEGTAIFNS